MTITNTAAPIDEARVQEIAQQVAFDIAVSAGVAMLELGDRLGLYKALAGAGPTTADTLAAQTGYQPRLVREWLLSQAAAGYLTLDPDLETFELGAEEALVVAVEDSPAFVGGIAEVVRAMYLGGDRLTDAFRSDGSVSWGEHHDCLYSGCDRSFGLAYKTHLVQEWIPAVDGLHETLLAGGRVLDVGCGSGISVIAMADAYPDARFVGIDSHRAAIERARRLAVEAGVVDRVTFEVGTAADVNVGGTFDAVCFFEALHDMGDPDAAIREAGRNLAEGGVVIAAEISARDSTADQVADPMSRLNFAASTALCTPGALSQRGPRALGNQVGVRRWREIFAANGFSRLEAVAATPILMVLAAQR